VAALRSSLAGAAAGQSLVLQVGDCAEDPAECAEDHVLRKTGLLGGLADALSEATGKPVIRVGRIAGQFAKPRSKPAEQVGDLTLPVFRGHMVNDPEPAPERRRPDPERILACHDAARNIVRVLDRHQQGASAGAERVWTSHEALLLDYEEPMVRELGDGTRWLGSTHWPWIGERTRQPTGAHVRLLSEVANPVACKIGPGIGPDEIVTLCERLDPLRMPGRLTLIARMGAGFVASRLPPLTRAVAAAGHPVIWLCDPMHGNTIVAPDGDKTRLMVTMLHEIQGFARALAGAAGVAGGLHLETTPDEVTECVWDASGISAVGDRRTTFCDPRLNTTQALTLVSAWAR